MKQGGLVVPLAMLFLASACGNTVPDEQNSKADVPRLFWTRTGHESCGRMNGEVYCFPDAYIVAKSFDTDKVVGYLFSVPIGDRDLINCTKRIQGVPFDCPHIQLRLNAVKEGDSFQEFYQRAKESELGSGPFALDTAWGEFTELGMSCLRYKAYPPPDADMLCYGGSIAHGDMAYFWHCSRDGRVPNPGCRDEVFHNGLIFGISYSKDCRPYVHRIRKYMIDFAESGRLLGGI